jgi:hypothetical protein
MNFQNRLWYNVVWTTKTLVTMCITGVQLHHDALQFLLSNKTETYVMWSVMNFEGPLPKKTVKFRKKLIFFLSLRNVARSTTTDCNERTSRASWQLAFRKSDCQPVVYVQIAPPPLIMHNILINTDVSIKLLRRPCHIRHFNSTFPIIYNIYLLRLFWLSKAFCLFIYLSIYLYIHPWST